MKNIVLLALCVFPSFLIFGQTQDQIQGDSSVVYGNSEWMVKNLNVSVFRNGDSIREARTPEEWRQATKEKRAVWCYFNNDSLNGSKYGKLYNWFAVNDPRGLAPVGWHVPTIDEWRALIEHFGGGNKREYIPGTTNLKPQPPYGNFMKSEEGWKNDGNGTNQTGFSGLPAGSRNSNGLFTGTQEFYFGPVGEIGAWWAADTWNNEMAWFVRLKYNEAKTFTAYQAMTFGLSVRLVKGDKEKSSSYYDKYAHLLSNFDSRDTISNNLITKDSLVRIAETNLPFTGTVKGVSKSGVLWYQNYIDGIKEGYYTSWYYPNAIKDFVTYKNGLGEGPAGRWSIEGNPIFEGSYTNDLNHGAWSFWNSKKHTKEINYYNNGKKDSLWVTWFDNGKELIKIKEGSFKDGNLEGAWKEWYEDGKPKSITNYANGKRNGLQLRWWSNGNRMSEETAVDGYAEGIIRKWHSNGQLQSEQKVINKERIYLKRWDTDGNEIKE